MQDGNINDILVRVATESGSIYYNMSRAIIFVKDVDGDWVMRAIYTPDLPLVGRGRVLTNYEWLNIKDLKLPCTWLWSNRRQGDVWDAVHPTLEDAHSRFY